MQIISKNSSVASGKVGIYDDDKTVPELDLNKVNRLNNPHRHDVSQNYEQIDEVIKHE
jgi:hypothetical protein